MSADGPEENPQKNPAEGGATQSDASGGTDARPEWARRHLWEIQPVRDVMLIAGVVGLIWLGSIISVVTVPLLLAILLAYLVEPVVCWVVKRGWVGRPFVAGALIVIAFTVVVVPAVIGAGIGLVQATRLAQVIDTRTEQVARSVASPDDQRLLEKVPEGPWRTIRDKIVEARTPPVEETDASGEATENNDLNGSSSGSSPDQAAASATRPDPAETIDWLIGLLRSNAQAIATKAASLGAGTVEAAIGVVSSIGVLGFTLFLTAFFFFFVCTGWPGVVKFRDKLIPDSEQDRAHDLLRKMDAAIAGFVRGRLTIALLQSLVFTIGYWAIGVPGFLVLGPLVALLSIVPYLALVGVPASIVLLYIETNGGFRDSWWWTIGAPLAIYFGGQAADDYIFTPAIQGKETGLDTPTILFATLAGGALLGVYGLLLAIPLAACIKILVTEVAVPRFERWASGEERDFLPIDEH